MIISTLKTEPPNERKEKTMTVKEFHAICTSTKEMYLDTRTGDRIRLDYSKPWDGQEITEWEKFNAIQDREICGIDIQTDHDGKPWLIIHII